MILPVQGQEVLPAYQQYVQPVPQVAAPGDAFTPTMTGGPAANTPTFAEWTRTAGPDESLVTTGVNFSRYTGTDEGKDTRFVVYGKNNTRRPARIQRLDGAKALLTLDQNLPAWSMYLLWPGNEAGFGAPVAINKTDSWWVGPDKATRGARVSVYGRNLAQHNDTLRSYVYLKPAGSAGQWTTVTRVNPYKVDFTVPAGLPNGEYEIWTHNGHGGQYGWSGPLKLTVADAPTWSTTAIFNVKNYGATGNGSTDDTPAIRNAIAAARQTPGATLYFPRGTYMVSNTLEIGWNIRWQGEGRDATFIKCAPTFSTSASALLQGSPTNAEIRDLTFDGNNNYRGTLDKPIHLRGSKDLLVENVRFNFPNYNILDLHLGYRVFFNNCEHIGITSFLGNCSQLFIDRNAFRLTNDTDHMLHSWGGVGVSMTNSTCRDLDNSDPYNGAGWGKGRFFVGNGTWGSNRFTYLGHNVTTDLTPRPYGADQNSGEQFLWELNVANWGGYATASTATTTTLSSAPEATSNGRYAVIIKGRGLGQSRRITGYSGSSITLEEAWNVLPDQTSYLVIGNFTDRIAVYRNYLDGKPRAVTSVDHIAAAGIEPYGGNLNFIADQNTLHELRQGIANWSTQHATGLDPNYFNLFSNNTIINCRIGLNNLSDVMRAEGTAILGTTYRKNNLQRPYLTGIENTTWYTTPAPVMEAMVYESNTFTEVPTGFQAKVSSESQLFYKNSFSRGGAGTAAAITITPKVALRENTYTSFAAPYSGTLPGAVIEAPLHVTELEAVTGGSAVSVPFTLKNSGITALNWTAASSAPWLTLSAASGTIADERGISTITLLANPAGLASGTHPATLTVTAGTQVRKYSVVLRLTAASTPTVRLTNPAPQAVFAAGAPITLTAEASDAAGIRQVAFFHGTTLLGEDATAPYSYSWSNPPAGTYALTAKATSHNQVVVASNPVIISVGNTESTPTCSGKGSITWEYWKNVSYGSRLSIPTENKPTETRQLSSFATPTNVGDGFGARVRGYICPPVTGEYVFFISADDMGELWLSTNDNPDNKQKIAYVNTATNIQQFDKYPSQRSQRIYLKAGQRYYIEALQQEIMSGDHLVVGWETPDGTPQKPIAGMHLIPYSTTQQSLLSARKPTESEIFESNINSELVAYPNPFRLSTTISFSLLHDEEYSLAVYDTRGVLVENLQNAKGKANQPIQVVWNAGSLSSGIYIIKLTTKSRTQNLRIVKE